MNKVIFKTLIRILGASISISIILLNKISFSHKNLYLTSKEILAETSKPNNSSVPAHVIRAHQKLIKKDLQGAAKEYDQALITNPNDTKSYFNRATIRLLQKDYEGAISDLNKVEDLSSKSGDTVLHQEALRELNLTKKHQKPKS